MGLAVGGAAALGFGLGAHFAPGTTALRNALKSVRNQNHHLEGRVAELMSTDAEAAAPASGSTDLGALAAALTSGEFDLKTIVPLVLKNPELLKVGLAAIQGRVGEGAAPGGGAAPALKKGAGTFTEI